MTTNREEMYFQKYLTLIALITLIIATTTADAQDRCPRVCGAIYAPVCGRRGREQETFSNMCLLRVRSCRSGWRKLIQVNSYILIKNSFF